MRYSEIISELKQLLDEESVFSSWIDDLTLDRNGDVIMTLLSGRRYRVSDVGEDMYGDWIGSMSKGKYWHNYIKNNFATYRIM